MWVERGVRRLVAAARAGEPDPLRRGFASGDLRLDPPALIDATEGLQARIDARFPDSNLSRLCGDLRALARKAERRTRWIRRPLLPLRLGVALLIAALMGVPALGLSGGTLQVEGGELGERLQALEAALSCVVILGAAALFLVTLEIRIKRRRALYALHELRILAHIVDMDQLGADPVDLSGPARKPGAAAPPLKPEELARSLIYCSELLALTSKLAVVYVYDFDDPVVLAGVDGLQRLLDGLSQRLWDKAGMAVRGVPLDRLPARLFGRLVGLPG